MADELNAIVGRAKKDKDILAVIVFGSYARKEAYRDIDVCLVLFPADSKKQYEHDKIVYHCHLQFQTEEAFGHRPIELPLPAML